MDFMPRNAPFVVLAFLGTVALVALSGAIFAWSVWRNRPDVQRKSMLGGGAVAMLYGLAILGASLTSRERVLAPGERKYFCEIDCHEAYSVAGVRKAAQIGDGPNTRKARGTFYIVTVQVLFDESTVSPRRPHDVPLHPNPRLVRLVDDRGRELEVDEAAQRALEQVEGKPAAGFDRQLRPGESYTKDLVFDAPADVSRPRLYVSNGEAFPVPFLLGHERSPFHKRILFALEEPPHS
jgi:hypothetical protein